MMPSILRRKRTNEPYDSEAALDEAEADVARHEVELGEREAAVAEALGRARARFDALEARLVTLSRAGTDGADALLRRLPSLGPPPGSAERQAALDARRQALAARQGAADRRAKRAGLVSEALGRAVQEIEAAEAEADRIEAGARAQADQLARAAAQAQADAEAARSAEAARAAAARTETAAVPLARIRPAPPADRAGPPRVHQRVRLDCQVDLGTRHNFYVGFAQNVSEGGLFVATFDFHPVGTEIDVAFTLPGGARVEARAVVRWVREVNELTPDVWPGMGLEFEGLHPEAVAMIARFVAEREPIFYPDA